MEYQPRALKNMNFQRVHRLRQPNRQAFLGRSMCGYHGRLRDAAITEANFNAWGKPTGKHVAMVSMPSLLYLYFYVYLLLGLPKPCNSG